MSDFTLADIRATRDAIAPSIVKTPVLRCHPGSEVARGGAGGVTLKLELFQIGGSFKIRGVLSVLSGQDAAALARGVTAVSAGNHAIAVAYAAKLKGLSAKVVMLKRSSPARVEACRALGAEIVQAEDVHEAFRVVDRIAAEEGRIFIHPYEGRGTALGTATVGLELMEQAPDVDAVIVPVGGGGLIAGVAAAVKMTKPDALVFGVEPFGADTMFRSFAAGAPQGIEKVQTIADSLGAPSAQPYSFALAREFTDEIVRVGDDEMKVAMRLLFRDAKLAVEPAGAAATAAFHGPLKTRLAGRQVGLIVCGANIDPAGYCALLNG